MKISNQEKIKRIFYDVFLYELTNHDIDIARADLDAWDSMGILLLAKKLEENFSVSLDNNEISLLTDLKSIKEILSKKGIDT